MDNYNQNGYDQNNYNQNNYDYNQNNYNYDQNTYVDPNYYGNQQYYAGPPPKNNRGIGWSIASLVLGILGFIVSTCLLCCFMWPFMVIPGLVSVLGVIFSIVALAKKYSGKAMAIIGLILNILTVLGGAIMLALTLLGFGVLAESGDLEDLLEDYGYYDYYEDYDYYY